MLIYNVSFDGDVGRLLGSCNSTTIVQGPGMVAVELIPLLGPKKHRGGDKVMSSQLP